MKTVMLAAMVVSMVSSGFAQSVMELKQRVEKLEARVAKLEAAAGGAPEAKASKEQAVEGERAKAKARMRKDLEVYSSEELGKIEKLYQVANKEWRTEQGKSSLKELVSKFDKANRTGCALLYLGQMSTGDEQIDYLTKAIEGFSDCYYGDGAQVGAYARMYLAYRYKQDKKADKANALFDEIKTQYPNAIDHRGNLLSEIIAKELK
jgi:TolA-binding protein